MQDVGHALANTSNNVYPAGVKFACSYGFWFPDKITVKEVTCLGDGTWSQHLDDGESKQYTSMYPKYTSMYPNS